MENTLNAGVAVFFFLSLFSWMIRSVHHSLKSVAFPVWVSLVAVATILMLFVCFNQPLHLLHIFILIYLAMVGVWAIIYMTAIRGRH